MPPKDESNKSIYKHYNMSPHYSAKGYTAILKHYREEISKAMSIPPSFLDNSDYDSDISSQESIDKCISENYFN